jgi:gas vesicle protein
MRRLVFFALGLLFGAAVGAAFTTLLTPWSGRELREQVQKRVQEAQLEGQLAAERRRAELEAQFAQMTTPKRPNR